MDAFFKKNTFKYIVYISNIQVFKWYRLLKKKCESRVSVQEECSQYGRLP